MQDGSLAEGMKQGRLNATSDPVSRLHSNCRHLKQDHSREWSRGDDVGFAGRHGWSGQWFAAQETFCLGSGYAVY